MQEAAPWVAGQQNQATFTLVDETLRDGLQSPSALDPPLERKISMLYAMADIGVDKASIGLPAASQRQREHTTQMAHEIARARLPMRASAAARTVASDVELVVEITQRTGLEIEVYSFLGSSPIRLFVEGWTTPWLLERVTVAGDTARRGQIPFCLVLEDTTRTNPALLLELIRAAVDVGARRVCLCDTVGHADAHGTRALVAFARRALDDLGARDVELDWHGHNDRGLALDNALVAAEAGVNGVHGCAGGFGERTGNVPLELLVDEAARRQMRPAVPNSLLSRYARIARAAIDSTAPRIEQHRGDGAALAPLSLRINGDPVTVSVAPQTTLLELLRGPLDLIGAKQGCDRGECGACTVLVDGEAVLSCLTLALSCDGREVTTVESLAGAPKRDALLDAFDRHGAGQCGFCTGAMVLTAKALLSRERRPTREQIRRAISGNLCRCTGYGPIVDAIHEAASAEPLDLREGPLPAPLPPHQERKP